MKIISWNLNGLRAVIKKNFFEYLENEKPDILGIQETKLQESQIPKKVKELDGYYQYWSFAEKKGYSGTALFCKEKPQNVSYSIGGKDEFNSEGRVIRADFENFVLFNVYFPNGQMNEERLKFKLDFYDQILELLIELKDNGKNIIVMGDFNTAHKEIDLKNPKSNAKTSGFLPIERAWIDKLISSGFVDTFREFNQDPDEYSWWSYRFKSREKNVGWRIDYLFVNEGFMKNVESSFIQQNIMGSDHCPVGIILK